MNDGIYKITCLNCKNSSKIRLYNSDRVMYIDHTPIISSRLRPDMKWGFECVCGNDTRLAVQEIGQLDMVVQNASTLKVQDLADRLKKRSKETFMMERI